MLIGEGPPRIPKKSAVLFYLLAVCPGHMLRIWAKIETNDMKGSEACPQKRLSLVPIQRTRQRKACVGVLGTIHAMTMFPHNISILLSEPHIKSVGGKNCFNLNLDNRTWTRRPSGTAAVGLANVLLLPRPHSSFFHRTHQGLNAI